MIEPQPSCTKTPPDKPAGRLRHPRYISFKEWRDPLPPFRNSECPDYEPCLARAAIDNLLLDCGECPRRDESDF